MPHLLRAPGFGAVHVAQVLDVETDGIARFHELRHHHLDAVVERRCLEVGVLLLVCCGAVAAIFTSKTSGNTNLMGRPATNSTASRMPASRKRACTPTSAMGISVCSKLSGSMKKQWFSSAYRNSRVCLSRAISSSFNSARKACSRSEEHT